jgi:hypothetical protein
MSGLSKVALLLCLALPVGMMYGQNTFPFPSSGNVGIGTTTPQNPLEAVEAGIQAGVNVIPNGGYGARASIGLGVNGTTNANSGWVIGQDLSAEGIKDLYWYDISNSATRLYIGTNGWVGIGTTSPQHLLHVAGTIRAGQQPTGGRRVLGDRRFRVRQSELLHYAGRGLVRGDRSGYRICLL